MNKIGIIQPHYIPYIGYFALIKKVDIFVLLDNVKYIKQEWKNRNKIRFNSNSDKNRWLTLELPKESENKKINEIIIYDIKRNILEHLKLIKNTYLKSPYYHDIVEIYKNVLEKIKTNSITLSNLNYLFIIEICKYLNIDNKIEFSSNINQNNNSNKNSYTINIIKKLDGNSYLANNKSFEYLDIDLFKTNKIEIIKQNYNFPIYKQSYKNKKLNFISNLSILDTIANLGKVAKIYL